MQLIFLYPSTPTYEGDLNLDQIMANRILV
jgi:hypothetical protein